MTLRVCPENAHHFVDVRPFAPTPMESASLDTCGDPEIIKHEEHQSLGRRRSPDPFPFTLFRDIELTPRKTWLIRDILGLGELSVWYGSPGCRKSVLIGDAACHVAGGLAWLGKPVRRCGVLYLAAERAGLMKRRMAAWRLKHGIDDVPVAVLRFDLCGSKKDSERVIATAAAFERTTNVPVGWIIVDTKAQTMGGGDENGAKDMNAYVDRTRMIQEATGAHVSIVDHVPHHDSSRMRGHGGLVGAADSTFRITKEGALGFLEVDKANDGPDEVRLAFTLESIPLSHDEETGELTTAPVVVPLGEASPNVTCDGRDVRDGKERRMKLSSQMRKVVEVIALAVAEGGTEAPPQVQGHTPRGMRVISKLMLDNYFTTAGLVDCDNKAARRTLWWRIRKDLVGSVLDSWADHFWLIPKPSQSVTGDVTSDARGDVSEPSPRTSHMPPLGGL